MMKFRVPELRVKEMNTAPVHSDGAYVLYWMIAARRMRWNFSLQRAAEWATHLRKPLLIFEPLRVNSQWASERMHRFIMQGMKDNRDASRNRPVTYYPYVEPEQNHGCGLLEALAADACVVVTDEFPCFFLPTLIRLAAHRSPARMEAIDSNGLLPMRGANRAFPTAHSFRRFLQHELPLHFDAFPLEDPLNEIDLPRLSGIPQDIATRWPAATEDLLQASPASLSLLPIDHSVGPAVFDGGSASAERKLKHFLAKNLVRYADERNSLENSAASGLSPYLHFGHISTHEIFSGIAASEQWSPEAIGPRPTGSREGWWGMSPSAEGFLDELITWREIGFNMCSQRTDYDQYESLPEWALNTLEKHLRDPRDWDYSLEELAKAQTHDELWNAAQRQLTREGWMHNYLRMLWGKKILEWTQSPRLALEYMIELNNRYAVDGRDPNSYSGIFWVLGRYDRAWGPERPIFGKVRYMTSESTRRKLKVNRFLDQYGPRKQKNDPGNLSPGS